MKFIRTLSGREKALLLIVIILAGLVFIRTPIQAAYEHSVKWYTDEELYELFYYSLEDDNPAITLMYVFAYIQRNPAEYANNLNGDTAEIENAYSKMLAAVKANDNFLRSVDAHLENCNKYPCGDDQASVTSIGSELFPPNMVKVCEGYSEKDPCAYLRAGEYTECVNDLRQLSREFTL